MPSPHYILDTVGAASRLPTGAAEAPSWMVLLQCIPIVPPGGGRGILAAAHLPGMVSVPLAVAAAPVKTAEAVRQGTVSRHEGPAP